MALRTESLSSKERPKHYDASQTPNAFVLTCILCDTKYGTSCTNWRRPDVPQPGSEEGLSPCQYVPSVLVSNRLQGPNNHSRHLSLSAAQIAFHCFPGLKKPGK